MRSSKTPDLSQTAEEKRNAFAINYNDPGKFKYEDDGFVFDSTSSQQKIKWSDIERLIAYKLDLLTTDRICIDIVYNEYQITVSEETPGWYQFVEKTKITFPSIPNNWEAEVMHPAFETNLTVIYQRPD
ncbi:hypothetical protein QEG73_07940 [Chitinophagaceae bacterium 26-R-25]|nr:hypothetical protein [Chitinophagaceae bacterium 26-R-25]